MYQYFINAADTDVERYLKLFTYHSVSEIEEISSDHMSAPEKRIGQKRLAYDVVRLIHGVKEAETSVKITQFMF
jgi:tyrosyl-tRNA synthetase